MPLDLERQIKETQAERAKLKGAALVGEVSYDQDIFGTGDKSQFVTELPMGKFLPTSFPP